uniref:Uncharacterized protein n=1 Tax=Oryza meridionalis TaxID=40149 RepID=A0A0E0FCP3_9ORYZ
MHKCFLQLLLKNPLALEKITVKFDPSCIFENPKEFREKINFNICLVIRGSRPHVIRSSVSVAYSMAP